MSSAAVHADAAKHSLSLVRQGYLTGGQDGYVCLWDQEFAKCLKIFPISNAYVTAGHMTLTTDHPSIRACAMGMGRIVAGTQRGEIVEIYEDGNICVTMAVSLLYPKQRIMSIIQTLFRIRYKYKYGLSSGVQNNTPMSEFVTSPGTV